MLVEDIGVISIQIGEEPAYDDWGRSFTCYRKRSSSRIESFGTLYFNAPVSEKNNNTNQKLPHARKPKYFLFLQITVWSKLSDAFWRSTNIIQVYICWSIPRQSLSIEPDKSVESVILKPDWYIYLSFFLLK